MTAWSRELGISRELIWQRINKLGWSVARALTTPANVYGRLIEFDGKSMTLCQWAKHLDMPLNTLRNRIDRDWPIEAVLATRSLPRGKNRDKP